MNQDQNSSQFIYKPPRFKYTEDQAAYLGLSDDRMERDFSVPQASKFGGGIRTVLLGDWLNDFNPIEKAAVLTEENPTALFVEAPLFKPITNLNKRKTGTKDAVLSYINALTLAGDTIVSFSADEKLSQSGIAAKSQAVSAAFIDEALSGALLVEFQKNAEMIDSALSELLTPPEGPTTPEEALIDIEIRSIYRGSEDLRKEAVSGNLSHRHDLALTRAEAVISGFNQNDFDNVFFAAAIRRNIKAAYQVDALLSMNCYLWLIFHRSVTELLKFSNFSQFDQETILKGLGLNWHGENLMSQFSKALYVVTKATESRELKLRPKVGQ